MTECDNVDVLATKAEAKVVFSPKTVRCGLLRQGFLPQGT